MILRIYRHICADFVVCYMHFQCITCFIQYFRFFYTTEKESQLLSKVLNISWCTCTLRAEDVLGNCEKMKSEQMPNASRSNKPPSNLWSERNWVAGTLNFTSPLLMLLHFQHQYMDRHQMRTPGPRAVELLLTSNIKMKFIS